LMVVLALAVYGVWLFLRDNVDFDLQRHEIVRALTGERAKTQEAMGDVDERLERQSQDIAAKEERIGHVDKVIAKINSLESTWDRLIGNPEQQAANHMQLGKMHAMRKVEQGELDELQNKFNRTTWERDGLEIALGRLEARLVTIEEQQSQVMHYAMTAWGKTRWWLLGALAVYFIGPTLGKSMLYYGIAPTIG
jgi:chromosome segregation ATPase